MTRVFLRTFGCRANHYDSERVRAMALSAGYQLVADPSDADVAVFNSCAVTSEAERDLRKAVRGASRSNPRVRSVIMGCASALPGNEAALLALPSVSHLVSGADESGLSTALGITSDEAPATVQQSSVRANLRIQDGCDEHCTFCATTIARGANRSRPAERVLDEAARLAEWHQEIVLTGTHIGTWGADTDSSLGLLVEQLVAAVPRVRFRLSSIEATEVDERLADLLADRGGRVAPHLHAPLQSGSDRLLSRMGRHWYTAGSYAAAVERLAGRLRVFGLGADVITGFPGETDADFEDTVRLVERLPFTYLHVFPYSTRPGTAATRLTDAVPADVSRARSARLRGIAEQKAAAHRARRAGGIADVIVIASGRGTRALTEDFLTVETAGRRAPGERFRARLELEDGSLRAM